MRPLLDDSIIVSDPVIYNNNILLIFFILQDDIILSDYDDDNHQVSHDVELDAHPQQDDRYMVTSDTDPISAFDLVRLIHFIIYLMIIIVYDKKHNY